MVGGQGKDEGKRSWKKGKGRGSQHKEGAAAKIFFNKGKREKQALALRQGLRY